MSIARTMPFVLTVLLAAAVAASDQPLDGKAVDKVTVQNVTLQGDVVSGVVANGSPHLVRDVKLQITYGWLWNNERHPGTDNPGRTDYYALPGDIPPGGSLPFTYRPATPLAKRNDGQFTAAASVTGFTETAP